MVVAIVGLDQQRIDAAGRLQRGETGKTHLRQKRRIGVDQPVEPIQQHADRQQIDQRKFLMCVGGRWWLFGGGDRRLARFGRQRVLRQFAFGAVALQPRRQLPGQLVEGVVLNRGQHQGAVVIGRPERQHVMRSIQGHVRDSGGNERCRGKRRRALEGGGARRHGGPRVIGGQHAIGGQRLRHRDGSLIVAEPQRRQLVERFQIAAHAEAAIAEIAAIAILRRQPG